MTNGKSGVLVDVSEIFKDKIDKRMPDISEIDKISTNPIETVEKILYGDEKNTGLLKLNSKTENPLSGDDTFSIMDPITMVCSVPLGYLIGIAEERMKESDLYGAAVAMGGIKDFTKPLSDYAQYFALKGLIEGYEKPKKEEKKPEVPPEYLPFIALMEAIRGGRKSEGMGEIERYLDEKLDKMLQDCKKYLSDSLSNLYVEFQPSYRIRMPEKEEDSESYFTNFSNYF